MCLCVDGLQPWREEPKDMCVCVCVWTGCSHGERSLKTRLQCLREHVYLCVCVYVCVCVCKNNSNRLQLMYWETERRVRVCMYKSPPYLCDFSTHVHLCKYVCMYICMYVYVCVCNKYNKAYAHK